MAAPQETGLFGMNPSSTSLTAGFGHMSVTLARSVTKYLHELDLGCLRCFDLEGKFPSTVCIFRGMLQKIK